MEMNETEFGEMHIGTFFLKLRFFNKKIDEGIKERAELVRLQTLHLLNIQIEPSKRITKLTDFWSFPWDEKEDTGLSVKTEEEAQAQLERLINAHKKHHG